MFLWYMDREMKNRTYEGSGERGAPRKDEQRKLGWYRQNTVNACAERITLKKIIANVQIVEDKNTICILSNRVKAWHSERE